MEISKKQKKMIIIITASLIIVFIAIGFILQHYLGFWLMSIPPDTFVVSDIAEFLLKHAPLWLVGKGIVNVDPYYLLYRSGNPMPYYMYSIKKNIVPTSDQSDSCLYEIKERKRIDPLPYLRKELLEYEPEKTVHILMVYIDLSEEDNKKIMELLRPYSQKEFIKLMNDYEKYYGAFGFKDIIKKYSYEKIVKDKSIFETMKNELVLMKIFNSEM